MVEGENMKDKVKNLIYLFKYFLKFGKGLFILSSLGLLYAPIQTYIIVQSTKYAVDSIVAQVAFSEIILTLSIYFGTSLLLHIYISYVDNYFWEVLTTKITAGIGREIYIKVVHTDYKYFDNSKFYDDYSWTVNNLSNNAMSAMHIVRTTISRVLNITTLVALMLSIDWKLIVVVFVSLILGFFIDNVRNKVNYEKSNELHKINRYQSYIHRLFYLKDYADAIRTTKIADIILDKYDKNVSKIDSIIKKYRTKLTILSICNNIQNVMFTAVCMMYLVYAITFNGISLGSFTALITSATQLKDSLGQLFNIANEINNTSLYTEKIKSFFTTQSFIESAKEVGENLSNGPFSVEVRNVSFKYSEDGDYVLKNINMTIRPKQKIAIVGANGAGKTTLVKLLLRLYDPDNGNIFLNGISLKSLKIENARERIGVAFQNSHIFAITAEENLKVFSNDISKTDVEKAIKKTGVDKFIKGNLNSQMTKEFDDEGVVLSGGQSQLFAITRLFTKEYSMLILDEPSAALDPIKEYELNQIIMNELADTTIIIISHRLSTIRDADCIYVLSDGEIVEQGTHNELMKLGCNYYDMFKKQSQNYLPKEGD